MTLPLHILAIFALLSGFVIIAGFDLAGGLWLGSYDMLMLIIFSRWTHVSVIVAVFGMFVAFLMYRLHWIKPGWFNGHGKGIIYRILADRYHIPQLYNQISWRFGYDIARVVDCFDRNIVDGIVNGLSNVVIGNADEVKKAETGYVRDYTMLVATGVVALVLTLVAITYVMGVI